MEKAPPVQALPVQAGWLRILVWGPFLALTLSCTLDKLLQNCFSVPHLGSGSNNIGCLTGLAREFSEMVHISLLFQSTPPGVSR